MYYNNIRLQSIYRNRLFYKRYNKLSIPIPKPLPHGEGLCMLCWLCICAIVVVCCRCVLHRLCSTTCMRPCIEPLGIHARRPCRAECGAAALTKQGRLQSVAHSRCTMQRHQRLTTRIGATPQTPFCATAAHKNSPDFSSGEFLLIDRGDVYKLSLYLVGAVSHLR